MKIFLIVILFQISNNFTIKDEPTTMRCYIQMRKINTSLQKGIFSVHQQIQNRKHLTPMLNSSFRILEQTNQKDNEDNKKNNQDKNQDQKEQIGDDQEDEQSSDEDDEDLENINDKIFEPLFREHTNKKTLKKIIKDLHSDLKEADNKFVSNKVEEVDVKENYKNNLLNLHHQLYFKCEAHGGNFEKLVDFQLDCKEQEKASIKIMHNNKVERTIVVNIANFFKNSDDQIDQLVDVYDFKHQFPRNLSFPDVFEEPEICTVFIKSINKLKVITAIIFIIHWFVNQLQWYKIGIQLKKNVKEFQFEILVKIIYS